MTQPKVVLVGPPGAGKTTIGRRLAHALNTTAVDSDALIEERTDQPCGDVYAALGEERFRELEAEVVAEALSGGGVLSLGGGAVVTQSTRALLAAHPVVWLDVSAAEGIDRTAGTNRPVLAGQDPVDRYRQLLDERRPWYREVSDYRVRTDERTPQQVVADVLAFLDAAHS